MTAYMEREIIAHISADPCEECEHYDELTGRCMKRGRKYRRCAHSICIMR